MKVAVIGATGLVGQTILKVHEERNFPAGELIPVASPRSAGKMILFKGKSGKAAETGNLVRLPEKQTRHCRLKQEI